MEYEPEILNSHGTTFDLSEFNIGSKVTNFAVSISFKHCLGYAESFLTQGKNNLVQCDVIFVIHFSVQKSVTC